MNYKPTEATGNRGELIAELRLTDYTTFKEPLFRPKFLGEKWPTADLYVELTGPEDAPRAHFLISIKSTKEPLDKKRRRINVSVTKKDVMRLKKYVGPTYVLAVHEPTENAWITAVHKSTPDKGISHISLKNKLSPVNLRLLHDEINAFWNGLAHKPCTSIF